MAETILDINDLNVRFDADDGAVHAVKNLSLKVAKGETLAIVGESGSGKSQTMMAVMGLLATNGKVTGSARYRGQELVGLPVKQLNDIRGAKITMIFQEPMTSLDPLYAIGDQLAEPIRYHRRISKAKARERALELLKLVQISDPERRLKSYPHEMSGGQRQRVMIAMALANDPELLIADEPTTALDVTIQAQILNLLKELKERIGLGIVFISHDLGIVKRFADRVAVMRRGEVVETGTVEQIFSAPQHDYTKMLLAAEPTGRKSPVDPSAPRLIEGRNVSITFKLGGGFLAGKPMELKAVDNVSLTLREGQTIGVVGESGSGKSTLGRLLLRLIDGEGRVIFIGKDISTSDRQAMRPLRRQMQLVFQDPYGSLSPRMTAGQIITEGLLVHEPHLTTAERDRRAVEALKEVGLDPATRNRYPHEFSGGQRQRLAIARAIILKPQLVVLDEPTSALDRSVQKQIVDLLRDLQARHKLAYLFISHDLAVVRALSDYIMVMKSGRVVEEGSTDEIFDRPREDYTRELMAAALGH
ncbi:ABC transporter ATP-binding protein [Rhizobium sp. TH2]|uniref:ABC transporter ATP-binding protein n=1 Tax=Rhizobium sp. TH2 TaxID=2775403 RepID=UPI002157EA1B|nr:ABC transporter ATP-binding protein [Rhizobium sp. TH2]UVC06533.1 ABC transporter ATP-binding protein [Rhizobium sp. TH2]